MRITNRLWSVAGLLSVMATVASAGPIVVLDTTDPTPAGPSAGTAGETLEQALPFTVFSATVTATPAGTSLAGDGLLANATSFGIDSTDGSDVPERIQTSLAETLTLTFNQPVTLLSVDLSNVGSSATDGARITIGSFSIDLFTGVSNFNGTTDVWGSTTPLNFTIAGNVPIVFSGSGASSSYGIQSLTVIIPEPASLSALLAGALVLARRRKA